MLQQEFPGEFSLVAEEVKISAFPEKWLQVGMVMGWGLSLLKRCLWTCNFQIFMSVSIQACWKQSIEEILSQLRRKFYLEGKY